MISKIATEAEWNQIAESLERRGRSDIAFAMAEPRFKSAEHNGVRYLRPGSTPIELAQVRAVSAAPAVRAVSAAPVPVAPVAPPPDIAFAMAERLRRLAAQSEADELAAIVARVRRDLDTSNEAA